jgi:hypothetical protein
MRLCNPAGAAALYMTVVGVRTTQSHTHYTRCAVPGVPTQDTCRLQSSWLIQKYISCTCTE